jgi:hypothetical protein
VRLVSERRLDSIQKAAVGPVLRNTPYFGAERLWEQVSGHGEALFPLPKHVPDGNGIRI